MILTPKKSAELAIENLAAKVSSQDTIHDSCKVLVMGIADLVRTAGTEPQPLNALYVELHDSAASLARAVTSNTGDDTERLVTTTAKPATDSGPAANGQSSAAEAKQDDRTKTAKK
jgi:hypothetical protein